MAQEGKTPFKIIWSNQEKSEQGPDEVYELSDYGLICVVDNGQLWCGCPCPTCKDGVQTVVSTEKSSSQTPPPSVVTTPPPVITFTPPVSTETPPPHIEEKQKCNQGGGNGSEGCDPGNSNNNQDSNDEPGGRGGGNNE